MPKWSLGERRIVFARIGWMHRYAGSVKDDVGPVGGGRYNQLNIGSEVYNFKRRGEWLYGYFETVTRAGHLEEPGPLSLQRIDATALDSDSLDDVLVILVSQQVIVGWYGQAQLIRHAKLRPAPDNDAHYRCRARVSDCVLLPDSRRKYPIPSGAGAMGKSNVCYPLNADGSPKGAAWMVKAVEYVDSYNGPNQLMTEVDEDSVAESAERELRRGQGRWVAADPQARRALEEYGVRRAMAYFIKQGYSNVKNVGATECYDVCGTKNGTRLCVEVKATTTTGEQVILTPNEVTLAGDRALFVLHSVEMVKGKPKGGEARVILPWTVQREHLKPVSYIYKLPSE